MRRRIEEKEKKEVASNERKVSDQMILAKWRSLSRSIQGQFRDLGAPSFSRGRIKGRGKNIIDRRERERERERERD